MVGEQAVGEISCLIERGEKSLLPRAPSRHHRVELTGAVPSRARPPPGRAARAVTRHPAKPRLSAAPQTKKTPRRAGRPAGCPGGGPRNGGGGKKEKARSHRKLLTQPEHDNGDNARARGLVGRRATVVARRSTEGAAWLDGACGRQRDTSLVRGGS